MHLYLCQSTVRVNVKNADPYLLTGIAVVIKTGIMAQFWEIAQAHFYRAKVFRFCNQKTYEWTDILTDVNRNLGWMQCVTAAVVAGLKVSQTYISKEYLLVVMLQHVILCRKWGYIHDLILLCLLRWVITLAWSFKACL